MDKRSPKLRAFYCKVKLPGAALKICGNTIGTFDMMIAAHAWSRDMVLVINNERHFQQMPDIIIENGAG